MADFSFEGLLGGINNAFSGGSSNYLDEYLTPDQRRMMQRNAMLAASAALLKAGGESTRRIGIGEALGEALQAGQGGYEKAQTGALTQMALKTKMDEAKKAKELQKMIAGIFSPQAATPGAAPVDAMLQPAAPMTLPKVGDPYLRRSIIENPERREDQVPMGQMQQMYTTQADLDALQNYKGSTVQLPPDLTAPVNRVPTAQAAAMLMNSNVAKANQYRQVAKMLEDDGQLEKAMLYQKFALELDPQNTSTGTALSKLIAERAMLPAGSPLIKAYDAAIEKESQFAPAAPKAGTLLSQLQAELVAATDPRIKQQIEARIQKEINNPPPQTVILNEGKEGFKNVMQLGSEFKNEPIYKEYQGMQTAFNQVNTALNQETPIGDLAGATKIMKLMDPGSVVRESELALAMAAAGRMDLLRNLLNRAITGEKLTPQQRLDFKALSNELYAAAGQAYNNKRGEYEAFGNAYKLPNLNTALGAPANVPSIVKPGAAPGGRPADIQSIIDQYRRTR